MDGSCFAYCNIPSFEVDESNPNYRSIDGVVFSKDLSMLVAFPSAFSDKHYVVPKTTKIIGFGAFMGSNIESVDLPDGLTSIGEWAFQSSCIRRLDMPNTVASVGELAFRFCQNLEEVRLSARLSSLPRQLFSCRPKLKDLGVPPNVNTISYSAIASCDGLENLYLHDGLKKLWTKDRCWELKESLKP